MAQHSSLSRFTYHVFLSFRGEDTRKNFTDHLYKALVDARILTFQDTPELERGERIKEELEKAIRESQGSVIVFSKDYTSSSWCLDELVFILERKDKFNHFVIPVFYDVSPAQLKNQTEEISNVAKHKEEQSPEKIHEWKAALREVKGLAGMNLADGHEAKFIQDIVIEIKTKLGRRVPLSDLQKQIEKKLSSVNPVLNDAEGKLLKFKKHVKPLLDELKVAVYDAQDLLQEIKTEALRQEIENKEGSSTSKEQVFISCPSHAFDHRAEKVLNSLESMQRSLESILERRSLVLGLGMEAPQTIESTPLVESCVYGRDEEKERLVALLLSDDNAGNQIGVIPIVGMGGIGKTTLAGLVYNDVRVEQHFDLRAWVCISKEFNVLKIFQDIYGSLTENDCSHMTNLQVLQSKLQTTLRGKRFFLVFDDIWNYNYDQLEEILMRPLQSGAHRSKIIVTTRDDKVADRMGRVDAHGLRPISDTDGWSLLKKHAFKNAGVAHAHAHLEEIGRKIVEKCGGLPLAIKSLGGLLRSNLSVDKWKRILNSDIWELSPDESNILPSLWLSYLNLPLPLKRCFAYCSIFPKNYLFETSELIGLWKAEDLLQPEEKKIAEEIGQDYFSDLISRSFFQLSSNPFKKFIMHDLINDLASFVAGKFYFRWEGNDSTPNNLTNTRHLWISPFVDDISRNVEVLQQAKHLRTFLSQPWTRFSKGLNELLPMLRCLRVLKLGRRDIEGLRVLKLTYHYGIEELPADLFNNLKLLRHLDLSWTSICRLPDTVCTLYNLQALLLSDCKRLIELPAKLGRLINLSHLDIEETPELKKMPGDMGKLKELQMLTKYVVDEETVGDNLPELEKLQNLRGKLCISGLHHSSSLEVYILRDKKFLNELKLDWDWNWGLGSELEWEEVNMVKAREVLEKLQPHLNLNRLVIHGYGGKMFPSWSGYYSSSNLLVSLELHDCVNCVSLPPLGQLPFLTKLKIFELDGVVSVGSEFYYGDGKNEPFRSLQSLTFEDVEGWKVWCHVEGGVFPNLVQLSVTSCTNLSGTLALDSWPAQMETLFPSLQSLFIKDCPKLECFPADGFPSDLKSLSIMRCKKLNAKDLQNLRRYLKLTGYMHELPADLFNNLKLLRHLDLSTTSIRRLPDTVCTLYNLQALLLSYCYRLIELPAKLGRLINLSHLDIRNTPKLMKMPGDMGKLKELQMLRIRSYVVDEESVGDNLPELEKLQNLRGELCISGLQHSSSLEVYILRDKKFLNELELKWGWEEVNMVKAREVLEKLQPHMNLKRLVINGYGGKMFPSWSGYYSSSNLLVSLELHDCVNCVSLPPLGQLPFLTKLKIFELDGVVSVGSEFYYGDGKNEPFRSLQSLTFEDVEGWKVWCHVEGGVFPNLVQLSVTSCPNLRRTLALDSWPAQMETLFPSLQSLYIHRCPELECFPADGFPSKLKSLDIEECKKLNAKDLQNLIKGLRRLTALEELRLDFDCDEKVDWIAKEEEGLLPTTLTLLQIHNLNCETIDAAKWFGHLNSLLFLMFEDCSALQCLPESGLPTSLQTLVIQRCSELQCLPESGLPSSLQTLEIWGCYKLQCLPESGLPSSLRILKICVCPAIQCSPDYGLPSSLSRLTIFKCPLLEDWGRSHNAYIPSSYSISS